MPQQQLTKEERVAIVQRAYADPVFFCRFFLKDWFPTDVPWVHRGILAVLTRKTDFLEKYGELDKIVKHFVWKVGDDEYAMFVRDENGIHLVVTTRNALMMPRGFSKTTLFNAATLYGILFHEFNFGLYVSESSPHAKAQLNTIKHELMSNERIVGLFGSLVPSKQSDLKWTDDLFETTTDIVMMARGRGGQVRGLNWKGKRPDWICVDDVEDEESVKTDEQREKTKKWFHAAVKYTVSRQKTARVNVLGTLLHDDSLLMDLMRNPEWTSIRFAAVDRDGDALWGYNWSLDQLQKEKERASQHGQLNSFYMELMSELRNEDDAKFRPAMIMYGTWEKDVLARALVIDPAISDKANADFCALAVASMHQGGWITLEDFFAKRGMSPREQVDKYFELSAKWNVSPRLHGVESIAYQAALIHLLREEMFRRKRYFEIQPIGHGTQRKVERVEGILQPRYAAGYIKHRMRFPELEGQLLDWPNGKKDGPDVVSMTVALLDPYAAAAADPEIDLGKDVYDPLPVWRSV